MNINEAVRTGGKFTDVFQQENLVTDDESKIQSPQLKSLEKQSALKLPILKTNLRLDKDERDLIQKGVTLDKEQIWALLEKKRFEELQVAAIKLQSDLIVKQRCPKCTLVPPC
jgi:hypothetical protein